MTRRWGVAALVLALGGTSLLVASALPREPSEPATRPNPFAVPPERILHAGVAHVTTRQPEFLLVVHRDLPGRAATTLLWYEGRGTAAGPGGRLALDAGGAPMLVDDRLGIQRLAWQLGNHEPAQVAWDGTTYWVATRAGWILLVDSLGVVRDSLAPPTAYGWVAVHQENVWLYRSPMQFSFPFGQTPPPLIHPVRGVAPAIPARRPANPLMGDLVNAGRVVPAEDGGLFYAPFIRDEIIRFDAHGDTLWVARRGLRHGVDEPSISLDGARRPVLDYAPVNIGFQVGPDGQLYLLSTPESTATRARLDRLDPHTGVVSATVDLETSMPTLAVDRDGRVYLLDPMQMLTGVAPAERSAFPSFDLEGLDGSAIRSDDLRGRVTLLNVWASWCAPCREEMPELEALWREFPADQFAFLAISEDVRPADARAFINEFGFHFPVALGRGRQRSRLHYFGLPYTVLLDREGRVVERWAGYGGPAQIATIRALVEAELARSSPVARDPETDHTQHH
ncbi:MAG: TlpA disulfide reductase family protein [Gemmatimonadales bacterium]